MGLLLSTYHIAVQFGWLADRCIISQKIENMNDFMQMLDQPKVSCSAIGWKLLALPASIYNANFSLVALIFFYFERQPKNSKRTKNNV